MRVIDETGKQLGFFPTPEAIQMAKDRNLDLIQVTKKVEPPVCRIMDFGKYLYREQKKEKPIRGSQGQLKGIRLGFGISGHDLEVKVSQAEKFLKKGYKVRVEMILRGREKSLPDFAREKMSQFVKALEEITPIKIDKELKREMRGFTIIISKG